MMTSSCRKEVFCYFHIGGQFVENVEGKVHYEGGKSKSKVIKEGTTYEELVGIIRSFREYQPDIAVLKYTVKFDYTTYVDLEDDEGVTQLIKFNDNYAHVYIVEHGNESREMVIESRNTFEHWSVNGNVASTSTQELDYVPCAVESVPATRPQLNATKWANLFIGVGQIFENADDFRATLYKYSIAHKFSYIFVRNSPEKMIVKCKMDGCKWKVTAYAIGKDTSFLCIKSFDNEHMHSAQDNLIISHMAKSKLTSSIMIEGLRSRLDKTPNEIRSELFREYGVNLTYRQAVRGKERALEQIYGLPEHSYMLIPWMCNRLMEVDPSTVAKWVSTDNKFEKLFIAYGCSINGFLLGCRPILYVDGCHLSGPYRGTMLAASAYDADNELFPLAYAIVSGETFENWLWFMQNLKDIIGSLEVTIVSDRHNAIIGAVSSIFGSERHAYCYRHIKENFSSEFSKVTRGIRRTTGNTKEDALKLLDAIAYARLEGDFRLAMGNLRVFCPKLANWLDTSGDIDKWALSRFPYRRWDNITTNLAESFNAWIVKERKHHVAALINKHREKLATKLYASKMAINNWKNGVGPNIEAKLKENVLRAETLEAEVYGVNLLLVRIGSVNVSVNLALQECTCRVWQMTGIPCAHACAAIKKVHGNVYAYVEECYLQSSQEKIYSQTMIPMETNDMPRCNALSVSDYLSQTLLMPPITTRPRGRPRTTRRESQFQHKKIYYCSRCHVAGHTRRTCKNPNPNPS